MVYVATKHAIEAIAHTLQLELQGFGVKVATITLVLSKTGFNDRAAEELWKWYDEEKKFTKKEEIKKAEEGLKNQFDPEDLDRKNGRSHPKANSPEVSLKLGWESP